MNVGDSDLPDAWMNISEAQVHATKMTRVGYIVIDLLQMEKSVKKICFTICSNLIAGRVFAMPGTHVARGPPFAGL